jgi:hypothetical protein
MPPETHYYVVSELSIPEVMMGRAAGFNLDGMVSTGMGSTCVDLTEDYTSLTDPSENGVDNALAGLVPQLGMLLQDSCPRGTPAAECLSTVLQQQIAEGDLLLIMEVGDINSFNNDSNVTVRFHLGRVQTCNPGCRWDSGAMRCRDNGTYGSMATSMCASATTEPACTAMEGVAGSCAPRLAGSRIAPGQTFDMMAVGPSLTGSIQGGRMRFRAEMFTVPVRTERFNLDLVLRNAELRANISEDGLSTGAIGGSLRVEDLANAAEMIMPGLGGTVRSVVGGLADMDPDPEDPETCRALSAGLLFSAVHAD